MTSAAEYLGTYATGSPEWHAARATGLGGSEIAAVLGLSPWESPIFLMDRPPTRPHWYELGEMYGEDTLFPGGRCKPHGCQDGDLTDVEAALLSTESEVPA